MYDIVFNGKGGMEIGMLAVRRPSIPAPELIYDPYTIPGRDGIIMPADVRYGPIEIEIEFNFMAPTPDDWARDFRKAKEWLRGSGELFFADDPDCFYIVYSTQILTSERTSRRIGTFTAVFSCDPWTYLKSGKTERPAAECRLNPGDTSHPIYHIESDEDWTLTVNGSSFSGSGETWIDTDLMIAYDDARNLVSTKTLGNYADLYLQPDDNEIQCAGGACKITPRWRVL